MSNRSVTTRKRVLFEARELWQNGYVTFDSETTGLEWEDQIIQWAVCDQEGNVQGSGYVKPTVPMSEGAFAVHGIGVCGAMEQKSGLGESGKKGRRYIFSFTFSSSMQGKILYHSSSGRSGVRNGRC